MISLYSGALSIANRAVLSWVSVWDDPPNSVVHSLIMSFELSLLFIISDSTLLSLLSFWLCSQILSLSTGPFSWVWSNILCIKSIIASWTRSLSWRSCINTGNSLKKVELLKGEFEVYLVEYNNSTGGKLVIQKNKILDLVEIKDKNILEIGPGTGNLTSKIIKKNPKKLIVIEKDDSLVDLLKDSFGSKIKIINEDVLKVDENSLLEEKLSVFGNLPYNISSQILCKWILNIKENSWFDCLVLMFQKEVADRIVAKFNNKNYGRLSIMANWKLDIEKICDVKPTSFSPVPKVDSSILFFKPKNNFLKISNPKNLEKVTRIFFMHRRKMIKKPYYQLLLLRQTLFRYVNLVLSSALDIVTC